MTLIRPRLTPDVAVQTDPLEADRDHVEEIRNILLDRASVDGTLHPAMSSALDKGTSTAAMAFAEAPGKFGIGKSDAMGWLWVASADGSGECHRRLRELRNEEGRQADAELVLEVGRVQAEVYAEHAGAGEDVADLESVFAGEMLPGRVVISAIGDSESKEGRDLARRFGSVVGCHLPYSGMLPARNAIHDGILERWPWLTSVARQVEDELAVLRMSGAECMRLRPLLFVGPPGCGKTSVAKFILDELCLFKTVVSCGGTSDSGGIGPVSRGWATARPGAAAAAVLEHRVANPGFILDEIDKSPDVDSKNGSAQGVLLSMTENEPFRDSCLLGTVDTTAMTFIATANNLKGVYDGLRQRFLVIRCEEPGVEHLETLLSNCFDDYRRDRGIDIRAYVDAGILDFGTSKHEVLRRFLRKDRSARVFRQVFDILANDLVRDLESRHSMMH